MVSKKSVDKQLKKLKFNYHAWGRGEVSELPNILMPDEKIFECANGVYEGGFALLVATNIRVLLVDKKPLNFLTVEDLRFDMINEIDYSHRLMGAHISISAGSKNLKFTSYNQQRLRKLIGHVQHCIAANKQQASDHQVDQKQHLEQINQQLQAYLLAQHQHQEALHQQLSGSGAGKQASSQAAQPEVALPNPVKPSPELSDYLFAQSLLQQHRAGQQAEPQAPPAAQSDAPPRPADDDTKHDIPATGPAPGQGDSHNPRMEDLYTEGMREIFGHRKTAVQQPATTQSAATEDQSNASWQQRLPNPLEINPLRIAYSKLPMALRNRKFGRPSFHAHSQSETTSMPLDTDGAETAVKKYRTRPA